MVKDLVLDIKEHDLILGDTTTNIISYDVIWGNLFGSDNTLDLLFCNIIIPHSDWSLISYDENEELVLNFRSAYMPVNNTFRIRPVKIVDGDYQLFDEAEDGHGQPAYSYHLNKTLGTQINACQLPIVDIDGEFKVKLKRNLENKLLSRAYVYSAKSTDLLIGYSDDQAAQLLSLCVPGSYYRYPATGVGLSSYINTVIEHTDLEKVFAQQFAADKKVLNEVVFDSKNGDLSVNFSSETEILDSGLIDPALLDMSLFNNATDSEIKKAVILDEKSVNDFILSLSEALNAYSNFTEILFFPDEEINTTRIIGDIQSGRINLNGEFVADEASDYYVISSDLEGGTLAMFDVDEDYSLSNSPDLVVNSLVSDTFYQSLIDQPRWVNSHCHKCFMLLKSANIKYMIRKDKYREGKGLFIIPATSENIKNTLAIVQDINTGRYLCMVSKNTNISDITIENITSHIYTLMK